MSDTVSSDLTHKVGPLPAWAWGAGIVGGFLFWRHHASVASAAATAAAVNDPNNVADPNAQPDPSASDATVTDLTGGSYGVPSSGYDPFAGLAGQTPGYNVSPTTGIASGSLAAPTSDLQWSTLAADYLQGSGNDPSTVQNALSKYLSGLTLTAPEQSVVNAALGQFGSPPEGTIPVLGPPPVAPLPTPAPAPAPAPTTPATPAPAPVTTPAPAPVALTAPHVTGAETAAKNAVLTWNRPTGAVAFMLYFQGKLMKIQTGTQHTTAVYRSGYKYGPFAVKAVGVTGKVGPLSNSVTVTFR